MEPFKRTHDLAVWLNRGNSIVVDKNGVEPGLYQGSISSGSFIPVMVAAYSGQGDKPSNYRRRITVPYLEQPLIKLAGDFRLIISVYRDKAIGTWFVGCKATQGGVPAHGECKLFYQGISSEYNSAISMISTAILSAILAFGERELALNGTLAWDCKACA